MYIAHELGKFESEVLELLPHELARWLAYFELKMDLEKKANRRAQQKVKTTRRKR